MKRPEVTFERISEGNVGESGSLALRRDQKSLVPTVFQSLEISRKNFAGRCWLPYGIRFEGQPIGVIVFSHPIGDPKMVNISGFYLGGEFQGLGLGLASISAGIRLVNEVFCSPETISLLVAEGNVRALNIYLKFGFERTGRRFGNEVELILPKAAYGKCPGSSGFS